MVKVLIYSSKEIYDNGSYDGRAEAALIAYALDEWTYQVVKNRFSTVYFFWEDQKDFEYHGQVSKYVLKRHIDRIERDEWQRDMDALKLQEKYKDHPLMELSKNE